MALLSAILSLLSRKLGDLLQALFGWSISGLFGRLPSKKQTALSVALILAIVWPLLVIGCFVPRIAAWAVALVPLHEWLGKGPLRILWIVLAATVPLIVGGIVSWVAPTEKQRSLLRTVLSGYPLTVGMFLSFLLTFFLVPLLKISAMARGWADEHIFVQPKHGSYHQVLRHLTYSCEQAGVPVQEEPMPWAMRAPTQVLRWFAHGALDAIVASDPRRLRGTGVELYLYPADLLIRGLPHHARRIRAAMTRQMMEAPAFLTEDSRAQAIEEELNRTWAQLSGESEAKEVRATVERRVPDISRVLDESDVPYGDWVILYTNVQRLELMACDAPWLNAEQAEVPPGEEAEKKEVVIMQNDPLPDVSTAELIKEAVGEARELLQKEIALAKDEAKQQVAAAKHVGMVWGAGTALLLLGLSMLLVALVLAIAPQPVPALVTGGVLLVLAGIAAAVGYKLLPTRPLSRTQKRLRQDLEAIKDPERAVEKHAAAAWHRKDAVVPGALHPTASS
jgi:uncharacterized membrane protein YqjE